MPDSIPEWLRTTFHDESELLPEKLALRFGVAFALGCVVAAIYRLTNGKSRGQVPNLIATLVLLTVLIAMVTMVIGGNVARAFSLVGALSIVRFRTVVEDTRDTAFVIFAVAVGMAVGAGFLTTPLVGIPFAALAAFLFRPRTESLAAVMPDATLLLRVGVGRDPESLLRPTFGKHLTLSRLESVATARQGAALELTYRVRLRRPEDVVGLVAELNGLEGVQGVELRQR